MSNTRQVNNPDLIVRGGPKLFANYISIVLYEIGGLGA
jgi:hypothetical protein